MLLRDLHLGILLLLKNQLLPIDGNRFPNDHSTRGNYAAATLGETASEVFLLTKLLFFLEGSELSGRHGLAIAQLDDTGSVFKGLLGLLLNLLRGRLLGRWSLLGRRLLDHLGLLGYYLMGTRLGLALRLVDRSNLGLLLVCLVNHLLLLASRRSWWSFGDDRGLDAVLEVLEIVGIAGRFLSLRSGDLLGLHWALDRLRRLRLLLLLGCLLLRRLRNWCKLRWLRGSGGSSDDPSLGLTFGGAVGCGDQLRRTIGEGYNLLSRAGQNDVGSRCYDVLWLRWLLLLLKLLLWLLNDGRRSLDDLCSELWPSWTNLELAGDGDGRSHRGSWPSTRARSLLCPRTIVADSGNVLWILRNLLLRHGNRRSLGNLL